MRLAWLLGACWFVAACEPAIQAGDAGGAEDGGIVALPDLTGVVRDLRDVNPTDGSLPQDGALPDGGEPATGPTRYPHDEVRSPVTTAVATRLAAIAAANLTRRNDVFMKVGASGTVSTNLLFCFAGDRQPKYELALDGRDALLSTIEFFRAGLIGMGTDATTPFDRVTKAALVGRSATWAITGSPSPLTSETTEINPRFAFVNYGTNDMGLASTPQAAVFPFYDNMATLLDQLETGGIVPIISGLNPRSDATKYSQLVPTWDVVTRALAEERQLPYVSLYLLSAPLANLGLLSDGIHGNVMVAGGDPQPCNFTAPGLQFNYNARNLASIEMMDRIKRVVLDGAAAPDPAPPALLGSGTAADPFLIDGLPFSHAFSTTGGESKLDTYPACNATQNESGPEIHYRLNLPSPTPVRALVFDRGTVDVDLHLMTANGQCSARNDRLIEKMLGGGQHGFVVDSFVSGGTSREGKYLFVVVACEAGDTACQ